MERKFLVIIVAALVVVAGVSVVLAFTLNGSKNPNFVIDSLVLDKHNVLTGHMVNATIVVRNIGEDGDKDVNVTVNGVLAGAKGVHLKAGGSATVIIPFNVTTAGNKTVVSGNRSTYLNGFDRITVGDYVKSSIVEKVSGMAPFTGTMTTTIKSKSLNYYVQNVSYDGFDLLPESDIYVSYGTKWSEGLENLTYVGMENISTVYGRLLASHYTYSFNSGEYRFVYDLYLDVSSEIRFRVTTTGPGVFVNIELIETNMPWVAEYF